ncbi:hypothetical protein [Streptomyces sp. NPDC096351]|uniref:hypothetical protein n=1 Tax=Streptomyces sp. NPDC096351 TaxID=3366087 RepID=UPI0037F9C6D2
MEKFTVGDIVRITGAVMTGNVGTVVHIDHKRQQYLVRVTDVTQNYFAEDDLELFTS